MSGLDKTRLVSLVQGQRWAALATQGPEGPYISFVAYAADIQRAGVLLHLSRLAPHTQYLLAQPRVALAISEPDEGNGDPQLLARVTLVGEAVILAKDHADYAAARARYLQRLPHAQQWFEFGDFILFRMEVQEARFVGGFARAFSLDQAQWQDIMAREL